MKHLGNYFDTRFNEVYDARHKCYTFIGYVNKLLSNFGHLYPKILSNLFKTYCCSYYIFCGIINQLDLKSAVLNGIKQSKESLDCHMIRIDSYLVP